MTKKQKILVTLFFVVLIAAAIIDLASGVSIMPFQGFADCIKAL
jgi:hypothetical protein